MDSIQRICSVENCDKKYRCSGYCSRHYRAYLRYGDPNRCNMKRTRKSDTHRLTDTYEYGILGSMKGRCNNPKDKAYKYYGERGITICERWNGKNGIVNFIADMGYRPSHKHSIDRIDNDKGYSPENCRWALPTVQGLNKRILKNTSGQVGVYKHRLKWQVRFRGISIGAYNTLEEAAEVYEAAKQEWLNKFI